MCSSEELGKAKYNTRTITKWNKPYLYLIYLMYNNSRWGYMSQRKVIESFGKDIDMTVEQLGRLVAVYKTLIESASSLNSITLASKSDVKDALKRVREVGEIIDELIDSLEYALCTWSKYLKLKTEYINCRMDICYIEAQVEEELRIQG